MFKPNPAFLLVHKLKSAPRALHQESKLTQKNLFNLPQVTNCAILIDNAKTSGGDLGRKIQGKNGNEECSKRDGQKSSFLSFLVLITPFIRTSSSSSIQPLIHAHFPSDKGGNILLSARFCVFVAFSTLLVRQMLPSFSLIGCLAAWLPSIISYISPTLWSTSPAISIAHVYQSLSRSLRTLVLLIQSNFSGQTGFMLVSFTVHYQYSSASSALIRQSFLTLLSDHKQLVHSQVPLYSFFHACCS